MKIEGEKEPHPVGHWIVSPSQWKPGGDFEHPWDDPDKFFASTKKAYQTDRAALSATIDRFKKIDSKVGTPAKDFLACWRRFSVEGNCS